MVPIFGKQLRELLSYSGTASGYEHRSRNAVCIRSMRGRGRGRGEGERRRGEGKGRGGEVENRERTEREEEGGG